MAVGIPTDRELWQRAQRGEHECFGLLFDRHARAVYNHAFRRCASWADAEDLTSAVFLQAWQRRDEVVLDRDSALPWLLGVSTYLTLNRHRALRRYRSMTARLAEPASAPDHADDVVARIDDERQMARLRAEVDRLPRQEREVIELCAWAGLDQQAAAVALGVAVGTIRSRLFRARQRLAARTGPALTSVE
jgi:RNA polymerase sigma-70 factor (ECF subfamily)